MCIVSSLLEGMPLPDTTVRVSWDFALDELIGDDLVWRTRWYPVLLEALDVTLFDTPCTVLLRVWR